MNKKNLDIGNKLQDKIEGLGEELSKFDLLNMAKSVDDFVHSEFYCLKVKGVHVYLKPKDVDKLLPILFEDKKKELADLKKQFEEL